jgi:hypothetical protein
LNLINHHCNAKKKKNNQNIIKIEKQGKYAKKLERTRAMREKSNSCGFL